MPQHAGVCNLMHHSRVIRYRISGRHQHKWQPGCAIGEFHPSVRGILPVNLSLPGSAPSQRIRKLANDNRQPGRRGVVLKGAMRHLPQFRNIRSQIQLPAVERQRYGNLGARVEIERNIMLCQNRFRLRDPIGQGYIRVLHKNHLEQRYVQHYR